MRCRLVVIIVVLLSQITLFAQSGAVHRDSPERTEYLHDSLQLSVTQRDSLNRPAIYTDIQNQFQNQLDSLNQPDSLNQCDSLTQSQCSLDSLRISSVSVGANLFYLASSSLNAHIWVPVSDNITVGLTAGLKPWPRWAPWDWDDKVSSRWRQYLLS